MLAASLHTGRLLAAVSTSKVPLQCSKAKEFGMAALPCCFHNAGQAMLPTSALLHSCRAQICSFVCSCHKDIYSKLKLKICLSQLSPVLSKWQPLRAVNMQAAGPGGCLSSCHAVKESRGIAKCSKSLCSRGLCADTAANVACVAVAACL